MRIKKSLVILLALCTFSFLTYSLSLNVQASDYTLERRQTNLRDYLEALKKNPNFDVEINGNDFTITFSDSALLSNDSEVQLYRSNGVNKISGNVLSGSFKVYLTGNALKLIKTTGSGAISSFLGGGLGFAASTIYNIISVESTFTHGRVFVFANYQFQYWYYQ